MSISLSPSGSTDSSQALHQMTSFAVCLWSASRLANFGAGLAFGQGRRGGTDDLMRLASGAGFEVGVLDPILLEGIRFQFEDGASPKPDVFMKQDGLG